MLLPKQVISFRQLRSEGFSKADSFSLYAALKIFPTPFKGIYYVPIAEERKGAFIETPSKVMSQALELFLNSDNFYFSCRTAEEALGLNWHPSGEVHIVNTKISKRINLKLRIERSNKRNTWRSKKVADLLSSYGNEIIFHKVKDISNAKTKDTPYGRFATKSQIKRDKKRFHEK